jgi:glutamyl-tRNA reductase
MTIVHVGVSHRTAPAKVLEKLADAELARLHDRLPGLSGG